jgi:hypothetical protein
MAVWHGATHEEDCPGDDTCSCEHKPFNDRVNAACNDRAERIEELEKKLAYEGAKTDIESFCVGHIEDGKQWWEHQIQAWHSGVDLTQEYIDLAVEYLELRGLLVRHPSMPWVYVMEVTA